jgi:hypothetical protein
MLAPRLRQQMLLKDLGIELLPPIKTPEELIKRRDELERRNQKEACGEKLHHSVYVILLDPARPSRVSGSVEASKEVIAFEPKSRPGQAVRLRWDDRVIGPRPFPEPQGRT